MKDDSPDQDYSTPEYRAQYDAAREKLDAAIKEFLTNIRDEDRFVLGWLVTIHTTSIELEQQGMSGVSSHTSYDMTMVARRGLAEIALDAAKNA